MDENELIRSAKRGDIDAFNQLVLLYQDMAYNVAYRVMGESAAAADATQEAFISAYRKLYQFQGDHFKSWLLRIVTNACYDELRRRQRRPTTSLDEFELQETTLVSDFSQGDNPEQHAQRSELTQAIQHCLGTLSDSQRLIAVLSDVEEYPYQEIARITGLPLGTVKSRLSRARVRLRDCLQAAQELLPSDYRLIND